MAIRILESVAHGRRANWFKVVGNLGTAIPPLAQAEIAFAGFGGSLYAHYLTTVSPLTFQMFYSTTILIIVLGGGAGSIRGVVVGSIVFVAVSEALRISPEYRMVMYGLVLLLLVFWLPNGLTPLIDRGLAMLSGARK